MCKYILWLAVISYFGLCFCCVCLSMCLSVCPCVYLSVLLSICLSVCLSMCNVPYNAKQHNHTCWYVIPFSSHPDENVCKKWSPLFQYKAGAGQTFSQPDHILYANEMSAVWWYCVYTVPYGILSLCTIQIHVCALCCVVILCGYCLCSWNTMLLKVVNIHWLF